MDLYDTIARRKHEHRERLRAALDSLIAQLADLGAERIILFGSVARGEADVDSDLDLLVVMPSTKSGDQWRDVVYGRTDRRVAADLLVFTVDEWRREHEVSPFLQEIAREGEVVYEKDLR